MGFPVISVTNVNKLSNITVYQNSISHKKFAFIFYFCEKFGIFIRITLTVDQLGNMDIFTILIFPIQKYGRSFLLFVPSIFSSVSYTLFNFWLNFFLCILFFFNAIVSEIVATVFLYVNFCILEFH